MKAPDQNPSQGQNQNQNQDQFQTDSRGAEIVSGQNQSSSPEQARGLASPLGSGKQSNTGIKPEGLSDTSFNAPDEAKRGAAKSAPGGGATWEGRGRHEGSASEAGGASRRAGSSEVEGSWLDSEWPSKVEDTLRTSWQRVSDSARGFKVSPTALAIGAAAVGVGAAAWFTRKQWMPNSGSADSSSASARTGSYGTPSQRGSAATADRGSSGSQSAGNQYGGKQSKHSRSK